MKPSTSDENALIPEAAAVRWWPRICACSARRTPVDIDISRTVWQHTQILQILAAITAPQIPENWKETVHSKTNPKPAERNPQFTSVIFVHIYRHIHLYFWCSVYTFCLLSSCSET